VLAGNGVTTKAEVSPSEEAVARKKLVEKVIY
jgi:hypothetical protein